MPLLDHFRPPVSDLVQWNSFHSNWATRIADQLSERLPEGFRAEEHIKLSGVEIDVAAFRNGEPFNEVELTPQEAAGWVPPPPVWDDPARYLDMFEVRVIQATGGHPIVAAIELVSPSNKDRPETREAFAAKVCAYLAAGVCVIVVDVVTERRANLHNEIVRLLDLPADRHLPPETQLYAVTYRPALRKRAPRLEQWPRTFVIGDELPQMPLRLTGELFVPVDLETTYTETCRDRRVFR